MNMLRVKAINKMLRVKAINKIFDLIKCWPKGVNKGAIFLEYICGNSVLPQEGWYCWVGSYESSSSWASWLIFNREGSLLWSLFLLVPCFCDFSSVFASLPKAVMVTYCCGVTKLKIHSKRWFINHVLTRWGRVSFTHAIIGSYDGLAPNRRNAVILSIGPLGINLSQIVFGIQTFSSKKNIWLSTSM